MKSIYEASTALDAHMILNLLAQEGIVGRIEGEYLPGAVGEIQAMNLVRVMVDDADYEVAGKVIRDWEAIEVQGDAENTKQPTIGLSAFLAGLMIGGVLMFWVCNSSVTEDGIDKPGEVVLDEVC